MVDNYVWLREKPNPEVRAYLEEENAYTDAIMKPTEPLQKKLYDEMLQPHQGNRRRSSLQGRRLLLLHAHRSRQAVLRSAAARRPAWTRRRRFCSTSTNWPRDRPSCRSRPSPSALTETCWPTATTTPDSASSRLAVKDLRTGQTLARSRRARRLRRLGQRQSDHLLHAGRRGLEAPVSALSSHRGIGRGRRAGLRRARRALQRRALQDAQRGLHLSGLTQPHHERSALHSRQAARPQTGRSSSRASRALNIIPTTTATRSTSASMTPGAISAWSTLRSPIPAARTGTKSWRTIRASCSTT